MLIVDIDQAIKALPCPIHGLYIGDLNDKSTWRVDYKDEATDKEKAKAVKYIEEVDVNKHSPSAFRAQAVDFLAKSDVKILRHLEESALGQQTYLTNDQYIALLQYRQTVRSSIK